MDRLSLMHTQRNVITGLAYFKHHSNIDASCGYGQFRILA
jgi:hypothetical protein